MNDSGASSLNGGGAAPVGACGHGSNVVDAAEGMQALHLPMPARSKGLKEDAQQTPKTRNFSAYFFLTWLDSS